MDRVNALTVRLVDGPHDGLRLQVVDRGPGDVLTLPCAARTHEYDLRPDTFGDCDLVGVVVP